MKFSLSNPPTSDAGLDATVSWLYELYETLSVVLENLDRDNLSGEIVRVLDKLSGE